MISEIPSDVARACLTLDGEWWECGVHRGNTTVLLADVIRSTRPRVLRGFDTFAGRPPKCAHDTGTSTTDFADCSFEKVRARIPEPWMHWHVGLMPASFSGLEQARIAFAYIDTDLYLSTVDALHFIWPRMLVDGIVLVDDYLEPHAWPGVRVAVDVFHREYPDVEAEVIGHRIGLRKKEWEC